MSGQPRTHLVLDTFVADGVQNVEVPNPRILLEVLVLPGAYRQIFPARVNDTLPHKRSIPPPQILNDVVLEDLKHAEIQGIFLSFDSSLSKTDHECFVQSMGGTGWHGIRMT